MYVCGMTVYDYCHLGHARVMVVFDMVHALAARLRFRGDLRAQYHRHRRQDHQARGREQANRSSALTARFIAAWTRMPPRWACTSPTSSRARPQYIAADAGDDRGCSSRRGWPIVAPTATSITRCAIFRATASSRASRSTTCAPASASKSTQAKHDPLDFVLWKRAKPGEPAWPVAMGRGPPGLAHRVLGDVRARCSASISTFTAAARICSFRITRTRSRSPRARTAILSSTTGCTTASCASTTRRCRSRSAIFSPCARCSPSYDAEVVRFFILRAHYRSPLNYSDQHLDDARQALTRLYTALKGARRRGGAGRLERPARRAVSRGDGRRLQYAGGGRGAVRSRQ